MHRVRGRQRRSHPLLPRWQWLIDRDRPLSCPWVVTFSHSVTPQINWNERGLLSVTLYKYFLLSITVSLCSAHGQLSRVEMALSLETIDHRLQMSANSAINLSYGPPTPGTPTAGCSLINEAQSGR